MRNITPPPHTHTYVQKSNEDTLKIFCVYHRPMQTIKQNGYVPIFVGNKVRRKMAKEGKVDESLIRKYMTGLLTDDFGEGDDISDLNRYVNEMTAVFWIWKHYKDIGNPSFIGLSHYRRFFAFNEHIPLLGRLWLPFGSTFIYDFVSDVSDHIDIRYAKEYFDFGYTILATRRYDAALLGDGDRSCRERFCHINPCWDGKLYDIMESLVLKAHPEYLPEVMTLREHGAHYLFNMFVMKKDAFFEYCEFIFPILLELQRHCPDSEDVSAMRAPGFLAEFLTSMFISHQVRCKNIAVKELNTIYIDNPENVRREKLPITSDKTLGYFKSAKKLQGRYLKFPQLCYLMLRKLNPKHWIR